MAGEVEKLPILDLRSYLPRTPWRIGWRQETKSLTVHYNGPPVQNRTRAGELMQLYNDAVWHMRTQGVGALKADGLQYEWAVLSDGTICLCRDRGSKLWHCANAIGNATSISIHLPVGGAQDATEIQWLNFTRLAEALINDARLAGRHLVKGHREWPRLDGVTQSPCPGPVIMRRLSGWRNGKTITQYRVAVAAANIRQGPGTDYDIALGGTAKYLRGQTFWSDGATIGESINGVVEWEHPITGVGFVSRALLVPA